MVLDCKNDKASNIVVDLIDNSPFHLKGSFNGPEDTPYEGGHFEVVREFYNRTTSASSRRILLLRILLYLNHTRSNRSR